VTIDADRRALLDFYSVGYDEAARLARPNNRLEFVRIQRLLRAWLSASGLGLADVGGGTGVTRPGDPVGAMPSCYSHTPDGLAAELGAAGLVDVHVLGIEGPGWTLLAPDLDAGHAERLLAQCLAAATSCDGQPQLASASAHLLAIGRRP